MYFIVLYSNIYFKVCNILVFSRTLDLIVVCDILYITFFIIVYNILVFSNIYFIIYNVLLFMTINECLFCEN